MALVSSARLPTLPAYLASALGAKAFLGEIFGVELEDETPSDALEHLFDSAKCEVDPENEIQKNRTEPIFDKNISQRILK